MVVHVKLLNDGLNISSSTVTTVLVVKQVGEPSIVEPRINSEHFLVLSSLSTIEGVDGQK